MVRTSDLYRLSPASDGVSVEYRGHKEDLFAAGCLKFGMSRYDHFHDDGHGGIWYVTSKAGPGKRGFIAVSYYSCNLALAGSLPGVRELFPEALVRMASRPVLRLVVDNTRRVEG